jgi:D-aminoacyl-tRNA deacylase
VRAVVQRVGTSSVRVDGRIVGSISSGLLVYLGVARGDAENDVRYIADKVASLRIFEDDGGKMNRSVLEMGREVLVISQFTLLADARKGRRPSFSESAAPDVARRLYEEVIAAFIAVGLTTQSGTFGAHMEISVLNQGPVTILLDSRRQF